MILSIFLAIFFIGTASLHAWDLSWDSIRFKLENPMPEWMEKQIEEDLAPFQEKGVRKEDIDATIRDVAKIPSGHLASFVRYTVKDNVLSWTSPCDSKDVRILHVVELLEDMALNLGLPDLDFLVSLWDSYDNPLFLEKTYCPVFTMCKLKGNPWGVLYPEFRFFDYRRRVFNDIVWTSDRSSWDQKIGKAFWRGMSSGGCYSEDGWDLMPRSRLTVLSKENPDLIDAFFTSPYSLNNQVKGWMESYGLFTIWNYPVDFVPYKYLVAMDGNTFASNFWWLLLSNCTVFKNDSDYSEWFYKGLEPYVHYVPYAIDLSDFKDKVTWIRTHDDEGREIAERGALFAKEHLTNEALVAYFYRLLLAYAEI